MIVDALASVVPTPAAYAAAEASLARMRGYVEHFPGGRAEPPPDEARFLALLAEAEVETAVVYTESYETTLGVAMPGNDEVAALVARHPDRLVGFAGVDPWRDDAVAELERAVRELGLRGVVVSPFKQRLAPTDARFARVLSACEALGVPVYLHSGINWWVDSSYEAGHPRHLDAAASAFPRLRIVALHCGWPWVLDTMMVAWRHPNVYLDLSAHRPRHFTVPESGFGPLLYYGDRMLADRVVFGSTFTLLGTTIRELADEVRALPLKDATIERWLAGNARRLLGLGD